MKRIAPIACALVVLSGTGLACNKDKTAAHHAKAAAQSGGKQTLCPVTGGEVNTNLFVDAAGKRIYACCPECRSEVKEDPATYIALLEKAGVTLEKAHAADPLKASK